MSSNVRSQCHERRCHQRPVILSREMVASNYDDNVTNCGNVTAAVFTLMLRPLTLLQLSLTLLRLSMTLQRPVTIVDTSATVIGSPATVVDTGATAARGRAQVVSP